jgi:hypothetical protein
MFVSTAAFARCGIMSTDKFDTVSRSRLARCAPYPLVGDSGDSQERTTIYMTPSPMRIHYEDAQDWLAQITSALLQTEQLLTPTPSTRMLRLAMGSLIPACHYLRTATKASHAIQKQKCSSDPIPLDIADLPSSRDVDCLERKSTACLC